MFKFFFPSAVLGVLFCGLPTGAQAAQTDRFSALDTNSDGKIVIEEFRAAFPNMNEQAFAVIDYNGDKVIDRNEWAEFTSTHGKPPSAPRREGAPMNNMPGDPLIPPPDSSDLPLMRPPLN